MGSGSGISTLGALATGEPTEVARATSQSVIQRFLVDIDAGIARQQYLRFRDQFVSLPLSLGPAVKEYPGEMSSPSDVDSGPLPLGVSLPATVVTLGAAQVEGVLFVVGIVAWLPRLLRLARRLTRAWTRLPHRQLDMDLCLPSSVGQRTDGIGRSLLSFPSKTAAGAAV